MNSALGASTASGAAEFSAAPAETVDVENAATEGAGSPPKGLSEAIGKFDRAAAARRQASAEENRREFLLLFPESSWGTLPLERYALGLAEGETFSKWAEFKTPDLGGIGGGSAHKHIIYKPRNRDGWHFPAEFANEQDAWAALRADVVRMLAFARESRWEEMSALMPFRFGAAVWLKTLHLYFPDNILAVYSPAHLAHFWFRLTGEAMKAAKQVPAVTLNRKLLQRLREEPGLIGLSPLELSYFLYEWEDPKSVRGIYKIAPGENAKLWNECLEGGYVCVGWSAVGDLTSYQGFNEFQKRFREWHIGTHGDTTGQRATATRKAREIWTLTKIEPGDLILANLPRILGELITVLEADKGGMGIVLPQSRQPFHVPANVYIVGTMNTADRSIKVLDAAIRRRFAFHEVMPDSSLLTGQRFGNLVLEDLLDHLNSVIVRKVGREKQIGHSVFLVDEEPVADVEEFAKRMRFEVIPLLQEYCYEDFRTLSE